MLFIVCIPFLVKAQTNTFPSSGNVGIGNTSPSYPLDVAGNIRQVSNNNFIVRPTTPVNAFIGFEFQRSVGSKIGGLLMNEATGELRLGGLDVNYFPTLYSNNTERVRITPDGNVGIGTTTPHFKLDINSPDDDGATRIRIANTSSSGTNAAGSMPTIEILGARGDGNITFEGRLALGTRRTDGTGITNQTLGAVLFGGQHGTDANFQASKILYPASIQGIAEGNFSSATAMPTGIVFMTGTTGHDVGTPNLIYGTERMRITSSGKVAIGTQNVNDPDYKLFVETGVRTRKIKVDQATWPDYVFNDDYNLRPLDEVERFISTNKHLPDVPSAAEVQKEGLNLGDNQAVLLQKIEELTLYVIELKKLIKDQQDQIDDLKTSKE
ncbi:MAG: hypothetical protein ACTHLE_17925 [Agriterribacter sp.]